MLPGGLRARLTSRHRAVVGAAPRSRPTRSRRRRGWSALDPGAFYRGILTAHPARSGVDIGRERRRGAQRSLADICARPGALAPAEAAGAAGDDDAYDDAFEPDGERAARPPSRGGR